MNSPQDSFKASHLYFDPHNEPRLPLGDWHLSAALSSRSGGSAYSASAGESTAPDGGDASTSGGESAWNPPKFEEPRTIPGGWDVSSLK